MTSKTFAEANRAMHPVEDQWHYKVMTEYGFTSDTPPQQGFSRAYQYKNADGDEIRCFTGIQADYWISPTSTGYSRALRPYLEKHHGPSS